MTGWRAACVGSVMMIAGVAATPASAQFFLQNYDYAGTGPAATTMPLSEALPGATPDEAKAALVWTMRSALNVAALQCQFEPTLLAVGNYNAMLLDHKDELKTSWDRLTKYFVRTAKTPKEGQATLDRFGTRTYSSFATVASQYGFCRTAHSIGRDLLFAPRGEFATIALGRMRELRNSLIPYGEQRFARSVGYNTVTVPRLDAICFNKKAEWQPKKCGTIAWPPSGNSAVAAQ